MEEDYSYYSYGGQGKSATTKKGQMRNRYSGGGAYHDEYYDDR